MNGWAILAIILLALFFLGQVRVGVRASYGADGLFAWLRFGAARVRVYPVKPKAKKQRPEKPKKAPPKEQAPAQIKGGALETIRALLPTVLDAAGWFWHRLQMDTLYIEVTAGASDPADAAMRYGQASAVLGALWGPLTHAFHVKDGRAQVTPDFTRDAFTVYATAALSLKIWQGLWLGLHFGLRGLKTVLRLRKAHRGQAMQEQQRKAA